MPVGMALEWYNKE